MVKLGSGFNLMPIDEFLKMSLRKRVQLIMGHRVQFLSGSDIVDTKDALNSLKARTGTGTGTGTG